VHCDGLNCYYLRNDGPLESKAAFAYGPTAFEFVFPVKLREGSHGYGFAKQQLYSTIDELNKERERSDTHESGWLAESENLRMVASALSQERERANANEAGWLRESERANRGEAELRLERQRSQKLHSELELARQRIVEIHTAFSENIRFNDIRTASFLEILYREKHSWLSRLFKCSPSKMCGVGATPISSRLAAKAPVASCAQSDRTPCPIPNDGKEAGDWPNLAAKLKGKEPLRVIMLNDNGFAFGAGIALRRQAESFLQAGHQVGVVGYMARQIEKTLNNPDIEHYSGWIGATAMPGVSSLDGHADENVAISVVQSVLDAGPDLVIAGNFHTAAWPVSILRELHRKGVPTIAYAHDCDWLSGGCGHPLWYDCTLYLEGCSDRTCPKPKDAYPILTTGVEENWKQRTIAYAEERIPLASNSLWSEECLRRRFGPEATIRNLPLGLDTSVFKPTDKKVARRLIGVPAEPFCVLLGSDDLAKEGKGARYCLEVIKRMASIPNLLFISFGHSSPEFELPNVHSIGYVRNEKDMAQLYQAADVFLNPTIVDSFGQTMLEASSCGVPVVCFPLCGVVDIARDGINALHAPPRDADGLIEAILRLRDDPELLARLSENGRRIVLEEYSLEKQYCNWEKWLVNLSSEAGERGGATSGGAAWDPCQPATNLATTFVATELKAVENRLAQLALDSFDVENCGTCVSGLSGTVGGLRSLGRARTFARDKQTVTVGIVTFNDRDALKKTLLSIFGQDYPNLEIVVVDGNSSDGSVELLMEYDGLIDIWVSEPDDGIYNAMNKVSRLASGDYTLFLGAGDWFVDPGAVSRAMSHTPKGVDVSYGHVIYVGTDGVELLAKAQDFDSKWRRLLAGDFGEGEGAWMAGLPPHQSIFMSTDVLRELQFDESIRVSADWDLLLRARAAGSVFHNHDQLVAVYPGGGFSADNQDQWIIDVWEAAKRHTGSPEKADQYFGPIYEVHAQIVRDHKNNSIGAEDEQ
jgi:glycosyltransferase involved in cell wall biosynthesis